MNFYPGNIKMKMKKSNFKRVTRRKITYNEKKKKK